MYVGLTRQRPGVVRISEVLARTKSLSKKRCCPQLSRQTRISRSQYTRRPGDTYQKVCSCETPRILANFRPIYNCFKKRCRLPTSVSCEHTVKQYCSVNYTYSKYTINIESSECIKIKLVKNDVSKSRSRLVL